MRYIAMILILIYCTSCTSFVENEKSDVSSSDKLSEMGIDYLHEKNYEVINEYGKTGEYIITKELLNDNLDQIATIWMNQTIEPDDFFGKNIIHYQYDISGHKFDGRYGIDNTSVCLMFCEDEIIGGYSWPNSKKILIGGVSNIDGLSIEEVHGISYKEFTNKWREKYKPEYWTEEVNEKYIQFLQHEGREYVD